MKHPSKVLESEIDAFLQRSGMPHTVFGWATALNPSLVKQIKEGRECRHKTTLQIRHYIAFANKEILSSRENH